MKFRRLSNIVASPSPLSIQGTIGNVSPWNVDHVSRADWWALAGIAGVDFLLNMSSKHETGRPRIVNNRCHCTTFKLSSNHLIYFPFPKY